MDHHYVVVFSSGAGAQEENLHRRTNMFQCLEDCYHELEGIRDWDYHVPEVIFQTRSSFHLI